MPSYTITDPTTSKSVTLTGDSPPTEEELNGIFAQVHGGVGNPPEVSVPTPPEEKGLLARIGDDLSQRGSNIQAMYQRANPAVVGTPAGIAIGAGQLAGGIADTGIELGKSAYNALVPQALKESMVNKPIADAKGLYNLLMPQGAKGAISSGWDTAKGTVGEMARQNPDAALAVDSLAQVPMAGAVLKGAGAVGREGLAIGKDALAASISPNRLANMAQSGLKIPVTSMKSAEQLATGKSLLEAGLTPTDAPKLLARRAELNAATRAAIAPVKDTAFDTSLIPANLHDLSYLEPYQTSAASKAAQGLTGQAVQPIQLTVGEAQKLKQSIDADLTNYYKSALRPGSAPTFTDAELQAAKQLRKTLQRGIEKVADVADLNAENSKLMRLEPYVEKATNHEMDVAGQPLSNAIKHMPTVIGDKVAKGELAVARNLYAMQQAGPNSKLLQTIKGLHAGLADLTTPAEISNIAEQVQLQLPAPERGFKLGTSGNVETPTRPVKVGVTSEALKALPAPGEAAPTEGSHIADSLARMFQIAQSPEGKRLLIERLSQEEKYSKLVEELRKVPTTKALPAGQGFTLPTAEQTRNELGAQYYLQDGNALDTAEGSLGMPRNVLAPKKSK